MGEFCSLAQWRTPVWVGMTAVAASFSTSALADTVVIQAKGTVPGSCAVALTTNFGAANFATAGTSTATAEVNCNTGFAIKATSQNGRVQNVKPATAGFDNKHPYSLSLSLPLDQGGSLSDSCAASAMVAGQTGCPMAIGSGLASNGKTAIFQTATLTASWQAPATPLLAGTYSDTITISVAPAS